MNVVIMNAWQVLFKAGPMIWPILFLSVLSMSIVFARVRAIAKIEEGLVKDTEVFLSSLREGKLKETIRLCEERQGILGGVVKAGVLKFGTSRDLIKGAMEESFDHRVGEIKAQMGILSMIVNLAPLLGLIGTVNAMTVVFHAVVARSNVLSPLTAGELASGIWQALLTTAAGLMVGTMSYLAYGFCAARINAVISQVEYSIIQVVNILQQLFELRDGGEKNHDQ